MSSMQRCTNPRPFYPLLPSLYLIMPTILFAFKQYNEQNNHSHTEILKSMFSSK